MNAWTWKCSSGRCTAEADFMALRLQLRAATLGTRQSHAGGIATVCSAVEMTAINGLVAIDRISKFAYVQSHERATQIQISKLI